MRRAFLGDSFDLVKQGLLRALAHIGAWQAHPMFTERVSTKEADSFSRLLGVPLISREVLEPSTDRDEYFAPACDCAAHVFLDPDTGLRLHKVGGRKGTSYLFAEELMRITRARQGRLSLVFDQSLGYGTARNDLARKLAALRARRLFGTAYVSHACFVLVATDRQLVTLAVRTLRNIGGLPADRFL